MDEFLNVEGWLINSGIIHSSGGVSGWFDSKLQKFSFLYPEITGYTLSYLIERYDCTQNENYMEQAEKCARFLQDILQEEGIPSTVDRNDGVNFHKKEKFYSFDLGIIAQAFMRIAAQKKEFTTTAERLCHLLIDRYCSEFEFIPFLGWNNDYERDEWSKIPNFHHAKNLIPLILAYESFGWRNQRDKVTFLFDFYFQKYKNFKPSNSRLHPAFYYIEGMVMAAHFFGREDVISSCYEKYKECLLLIDVKNTTSDVLAQALRLKLLFEEDVDNKEILTNASHEIINRISKEKDHSYGGLSYWATSGEGLIHYNSWAALFWLQAENWKICGAGFEKIY